MRCVNVRQKPSMQTVNVRVRFGWSQKSQPKIKNTRTGSLKYVSRVKTWTPQKKHTGSTYWLQPLDAPTGCIYGSWMCATRISDRLQIQVQAKLGI